MIETTYILMAYAAACAVFLKIASQDFWTLRIANNGVFVAILLYVIAYLCGFLPIMLSPDRTTDVISPAMLDRLFNPTGDLGAAILLFSTGFCLWLLKLFGAGDAKLLFPIGLLLGWHYLLPFAFGLCLFGGAAYVTLKLLAPARQGTSRIAGRISEIRETGKIPYGVILAAAFLPALAAKYYAVLQ